MLIQIQRSLTFTSQSKTPKEQLEDVEELVLIDFENDLAEGSYIAFERQTDSTLHLKLQTDEVSDHRNGDGKV